MDTSEDLPRPRFLYNYMGPQDVIVNHRASLRTEKKHDQVQLSDTFPHRPSWSHLGRRPRRPDQDWGSGAGGTTCEGKK